MDLTTFVFIIERRARDEGIPSANEVYKNLLKLFDKEKSYRKKVSDSTYRRRFTGYYNKRDEIYDLVDIMWLCKKDFMFAETWEPSDMYTSDSDSGIFTVVLANLTDNIAHIFKYEDKQEFKDVFEYIESIDPAVATGYRGFLQI